MEESVQLPWRNPAFSTSASTDAEKRMTVAPLNCVKLARPGSRAAYVPKPASSTMADLLKVAGVAA